MPPKRTDNPKFGRQLNVKCSDAFFELTESIRQLEGLGVAECIRTLFLDQGLRHMALAIELKILTFADIERIVSARADGEWAGLYKGFVEVLREIGLRDPTYRRRYGLFMVQELVDADSPQLPTAAVKGIIRKSNQPQGVFA